MEGQTLKLEMTRLIATAFARSMAVGIMVGAVLVGIAAIFSW
jgi:hypothetical protein